MEKKFMKRCLRFLIKKMQTTGLAPMVEHPLSMRGTLGSAPGSAQNRWCKPVILALGRRRQEGQKFKTILHYTADSRPVWATRDSLNHKKEIRKRCSVPLIGTASMKRSDKACKHRWASPHSGIHQSVFKQLKQGYGKTQ